MSVTNSIKNNSLVQAIGLIDFESVPTLPRREAAVTPEKLPSRLDGTDGDDSEDELFEREDTVIIHRLPDFNNASRISENTLTNRVKKLEQSERSELMDELNHLMSLLSTKVDRDKKTPTINLRERGLGLLLLGTKGNSSIPEQGMFANVTNIFRWNISTNSLIQKIKDVRAKLNDQNVFYACSVDSDDNSDDSILDNVKKALQQQQLDLKDGDPQAIVKLKEQLKGLLDRLQKLSPTDEEELCKIWIQIERLKGKISGFGFQQDSEFINKINPFVERTALIDSLEGANGYFIDMTQTSDAQRKRALISLAHREMQSAYQRLDKSLKNVDQRKAEIEAFGSRVKKFTNNPYEKEWQAALASFNKIIHYINIMSNFTKEDLPLAFQVALPKMVTNCNLIRKEDKRHFLSWGKYICAVLNNKDGAVELIKNAIELDLQDQCANIAKAKNPELYAELDDFVRSKDGLETEDSKIELISKYINYLGILYVAKKAQVERLLNAPLIENDPTPVLDAPQQTMPQTPPVITPILPPPPPHPVFVGNPTPSFTDPTPQPFTAPTQPVYGYYTPPVAGSYPPLTPPVTIPALQQPPYNPYFAPFPQQQREIAPSMPPQPFYTTSSAGSYSQPQVTAPITPPPSYEDSLFAARQQELQKLAGIRDRILRNEKINDGELQKNKLLYRTVNGHYVNALNSDLKSRGITSINELPLDVRQACVRTYSLYALNRTLRDESVKNSNLSNAGS